MNTFNFPWKVVITVGLLTSAECAYAEQCPFAIDTNNVQSPIYRQVLDYEEFVCEGFFTQQISQAYVEPISLTLGQIKENADEILLHVSGKNHKQNVPIRLQVVPLFTGLNYRMDAILNQSENLNWNLEQLKQSTPLKSQHLGFLAWSITNNCAQGKATECLLYHPLQFEKLANADYAVLRIRNSAPIKNARWRSHPKNCPGKRNPGAWMHLQDEILSWRTTEIIFNPSDCGTQHILIRAKDKDGRDITPLSIYIAY